MSSASTRESDPRQYLRGSIVTESPMPARLDFVTPLMRMPGPKLLKSDLGLALEDGELIVRLKLPRGPAAPAVGAVPTTYTWTLAQTLPLPVEIRSDLDWKISEYRVVDAVDGMPPPKPQRGRPLKKKVLVPIAGASPLVKRPRGRPRKNPPAVVAAPPPREERAVPSEEEPMHSSSDDEEDSSENGAESSSSRSPSDREPEREAEREAEAEAEKDTSD